ncbi:MAG: AbrB/MazE/SpoVT family DNA-binding domain-containing protein [archaeon]|mgnify:CR=1 FL=1
MAKTVLSSKGQLILPAEFRERRKVLPGTEFSVQELPGGGYMFIPIPKDPIKALRGIAKHLDISSSDIKKMRREDDRRREKKLGF